MVGFLSCCDCGERVLLDDPGGLRRAVERFCAHHSHRRDSRAVVQLGIDPPAEAPVDRVRDKLLAGASPDGETAPPADRTRMERAFDSAQ